MDVKLYRVGPVAVVAMGIWGLVCKRKRERGYYSGHCAYPKEQGSKHPSADSHRHRKESRLLVVLALILTASYARADEGIRNQFGVRTPMRDGVNLSSDIWFPREPGRYPIILFRTPYVKAEGMSGFVPPLAEFFAEHGYIFVIQDTRGRGDSEGAFNFLFSEGKDGYDTIEWLAAQPWSNGKVGMIGVSYMGTVQWLAAREHPPHLVCIMPTGPSGRYFNEIPYYGGAFSLAFSLNWLNATSDHSEQGPNTVGIDIDKILKLRPLLTVDEKFGRRIPLYRDFLQHDTLDDYWKRIQFTEEDFKSINVPALTTTGWFDGDQFGALFYWRGMRAYSPAKNNQYLLIGSWTHQQAFMGGERKLGDFEFSADSIFDLRTLQLAFLDHFLKGTAPRFDFPRAHIYVTGSNKWRDEEEYPPAAVRTRGLYLHSGGRANTLGGDGRLTWETPNSEAVDHFTYDPERPVSPAAREELGTDQRYIERRDDVLVYSSGVLGQPVEIIGNVVVHLYAASDARDTDFTARLIDVYPDGRALHLGALPAAIIRARYRNSLEHTELLVRGHTEHYQIDLGDFGHTFLPGHRIRVEISSSYVPMFSPNSNTGNPVATDLESQIAKQTIFHTRTAASYIALPIIDSH